MVKDRIRARREELGQSHREMASAVGLSLEGYYDLEGHDTEFWSVISIGEIRRLCELLSLSFAELVGDDYRPAPHEISRPAERPAHGLPVAIADLSALSQMISRDIAAKSVSVEQWSDAAGWDVTEFLRSPDSGWNWTVDWVRDVCHACNADWRLLLESVCSPEGETKGSGGSGNGDIPHSD